MASRENPSCQLVVGRIAPAIQLDPIGRIAVVENEPSCDRAGGLQGHNDGIGFISAHFDATGELARVMVEVEPPLLPRLEITDHERIRLEIFPADCRTGTLSAG